MNSFRCKDIGLSCRFEAMAENEDLLMDYIEIHTEKVHDIAGITPEFGEKIRKAIKYDYDIF
jgi:predicted small metal-binding protein